MTPISAICVGCMGAWTGVMVTGNTLCLVTNPDCCCIVMMVVFLCSGKLTRLYSMSVYCLEYRQAAAESRNMVSSITEGNQSSTYSMETWINTSAYVSWKPKYFHLLGETSRQILCSKMTMVEHTEHDASWISSNMRICSTWIGLICYRIRTQSRTSGMKSHVNWTTWTTPQQTWLDWPRLLLISGEIFWIKSSQSPFRACLDTYVMYTTPEEATRSIDFLFVFRGTLHCVIMQNVYFNNRVHNVLYVWQLITTTTTTTITTLFVW